MYEGQTVITAVMVVESPERFKIQEAMPFVSGLGRPEEAFSIFLIEDIENAKLYVSWAKTQEDNLDDECRAIDMADVRFLSSFQEMKPASLKGRKKATIEVRKRSARLLAAARKETPYYDGVKGEIWFVINDQVPPENTGYLSGVSHLTESLGRIAQSR